MALPFLPEEEIPRIWRHLKAKATTAPLTVLADYVEENWISSSMWPPSAWSVYDRAIRTNNAIEGWHNALNNRANNRCQLPLYLLIDLLHKEATLVSIQIRLVSERKLNKERSTDKSSNALQSSRQYTNDTSSLQESC